MDAVERTIERCQSLTEEEIGRLSDAWLSRHRRDGQAIRNTLTADAMETIRQANNPSWQAEAERACEGVAIALRAPLYAWPNLGDSLPAGAAMEAIRHRLLALQARDILTQEQYDEMSAPWREVMGDRNPTYW